MSLLTTNLCFEREETLLFNKLTFSVNPGQLLHIKGKNGSGKTTLLKLLGGILLPHQGSITWNGINIQELRHCFYQSVCYIGHANAVTMQLTPYENLHFASVAYPLKTTIPHALEQLGLAYYADRKASQLSAGLCRRIALARLALLDTPLWLLDEPYTSLDTESMTLVNKLIEQQLANNYSVIITSHQAITLNSVIPQEILLS